MTRKEVYDILNAMHPTYWLAQPQGECKKPYFVIKYKNKTLSIGNGKAGWLYIDVMVYVPMASISPMDGIINEVKSALSGKLEPTGNETPDYLDTDVKAYMRSVEFRAPQEII